MVENRGCLTARFQISKPRRRPARRSASRSSRPCVARGANLAAASDLPTFGNRRTARTSGTVAPISRRRTRKRMSRRQPPPRPRSREPCRRVRSPDIRQQANRRNVRHGCPDLPTANRYTRAKNQFFDFSQYGVTLAQRLIAACWGCLPKSRERTYTGGHRQSLAYAVPPSELPPPLPCAASVPSVRLVGRQ